jgi:hypothetical protein
VMKTHAVLAIVVLVLAQMLTKQQMEHVKQHLLKQIPNRRFPPHGHTYSTDSLTAKQFRSPPSFADIEL